MMLSELPAEVRGRSYGKISIIYIIMDKRMFALKGPMVDMEIFLMTN